MPSDPQKTNNDNLLEMLTELQEGRSNLLDVYQNIRQIRISDKTHITSDACVDLERSTRCGFPEVVYCEGKAPESVVEIVTSLDEAGQAILCTRVSIAQSEQIKQKFSNLEHNPIARTVRTPDSDLDRIPSQATVISAGTSDRPVAEEAYETLKWMGCQTDLIMDVGVAGLHRLLENQDRFKNVAAIVVAAGMEGALPSVVGGLVSCPVVAVPTSVGYGANFRGLAALLGMLNSCAANVTVVNIDAGFKAGYVAGLIAHQSKSGCKDEVSSR